MENQNSSGKTSTDPQENEIDSNVFANGFRKIFGTNAHEADKTADDAAQEEKTVDEAQDPAND